MSIKDFKVGQTVWIRLTGNAARGKSGAEELIEEWKIVSVGRKYIIAVRKGNSIETTFEIRECGYFGKPVNKTNTCVNYIMYTSKEEILEEFEKVKLFSEVDKYFRNFRSERNITLEQIRKIHKILFAKAD